MSAQEEERDLDGIFGFLESAKSEYLDRKADSKFYRNRSQLEILGDALVILQERPLSVSNFIHACHSNNVQFKPMMALLLGKKYVERYRKFPELPPSMRSNNLYYRITEMGVQAAELYKRTKLLFTE